MGYIRKHRNGIRSLVELTLVFALTIGLAPGLIALSILGY